MDYENLGDEAIWEATQNAFEADNIAHVPLVQNLILKKLMQSKTYKLGILGGGTLIGNNLKDGSNPFREQFQFITSMSKHNIVLGTGVGYLSTNSSDNLWLKSWKPILNNCTYIGVRGPESIRTLNSIGIKADLFGDTACLFAQESGYWSPTNRNIIGVNIRRMWLNDNQVGFSKTFGEIKSFLSDQIKKGSEIRFFIVSPEDIEINKKMVEELNIGQVHLYYFFKSTMDYLSAVKCVNVFIGIRLHSVILAMCAGVPSIMIEYNKKCHDFMKSVDMQDFGIDSNLVTQARLQNLLDCIVLEQDNIALKIARNMNFIKDKQLKKIQEIKSSFLS